MRALASILLAVALAVSGAACAGNLRPAGGSLVPAAARSAGYTLNTFSTNSSFNATTVDRSITNGTGFQWYYWNYFGATPAATQAVPNADGSITVNNAVGTLNGALVSAAAIAGAPYYVGTAFGGGAYIEAEVAFDANSVDMSTGWPSWWTMALEHLDNDHGDQWTGQAAGYQHFIEVDTFEYNRKRGSNTYGGSLHDWYGIFNVTCQAFCAADSDFASGTKAVPPQTDWSLYHRIAMLWVPATSGSSGSVTFYFDDEPMGSPVTYSQFTGQAPPPGGAAAWTFGILDQQHLVLIFGTGSSTPIKVRSVNVWQASAASNLHN